MKGIAISVQNNTKSTINKYIYGHFSEKSKGKVCFGRPV